MLNHSDSAFKGMRQLYKVNTKRPFWAHATERQEIANSENRTQLGGKPLPLRNISLTSEAKAQMYTADTTQQAIARWRKEHPVFGFGNPPDLQRPITREKPPEINTSKKNTETDRKPMPAPHVEILHAIDTGIKGAASKSLPVQELKEITNRVRDWIQISKIKARLPKEIQDQLVHLSAEAKFASLGSEKWDEKSTSTKAEEFRKAAQNYLQFIRDLPQLYETTSKKLAVANQPDAQNRQHSPEIVPKEVKNGESSDKRSGELTERDRKPTPASHEGILHAIDTGIKGAASKSLPVQELEEITNRVREWTKKNNVEACLPKKLQDQLLDLSVEAKIASLGSEKWDESTSTEAQKFREAAQNYLQFIRDKITPKEVENIDYKQLLQGKDKPVRVIFFGDNHIDPRIRSYLREIAEELKKAGITHCAIEMPDTMKHTFDRLNNKNEVTDLSQIEMPTRLSNDDKLLMQTMADNGITLVPIDHPHRDDTIPREQAEAYSARNLTGLLDSNPEIKVAVLVGLYHARRGVQDDHTTLSLAQRITEAEYPTVTIGFDSRFSKEGGPIDGIDRSIYQSEITTSNVLSIGVDYKISLPPLTNDEYQNLKECFRRGTAQIVRKRLIRGILDAIGNK